MESATGPGRKHGAWVALAALLLVSLLHSGWNALRVPLLTGFDEPGHAGYVLTLVRDARLPHPLEGWSTFHPPFYYLVASLLWRLAEPLGPSALILALRSIGVAATTISAVAAFLLVRRVDGDVMTATVATLLVVFVPCRQLSTTMIGNEATAAAVIALALLALCAFQRQPDRLGYAIAAGALIGLALATKFTALALLPACAIPFLRAGRDARWLRGTLVCALTIAALAGPVYARNLALTGTIVPMTRELEPMRTTEQVFVLRPREVADYVRIPWGVLLNPSIRALAPDGNGRWLNHDMESVWGLVHAGVWYDPFGVRVPARLRDEGSSIGTVLTVLGIIPTLLTLAGLARATGMMLSTRLRDPDAPVTVFSWVALGLFVRFTWTAPALVAAKASYLLPLGVPCALFFARGLAVLGPRLRRVALGASLVAAGRARSASPRAPYSTPGQRLLRSWSSGRLRRPGFRRDICSRPSPRSEWCPAPSLRRNARDMFPRRTTLHRTCWARRPYSTFGAVLSPPGAAVAPCSRRRSSSWRRIAASAAPPRARPSRSACSAAARSPRTRCAWATSSSSNWVE